jgi:hypothetical protein
VSYQFQYGGNSRMRRKTKPHVVGSLCHTHLHGRALGQVEVVFEPGCPECRRRNGMEPLPKETR